MYLLRTRGRGFVFMFCAICNWLMNEWINQIHSWLVDWLTEQPCYSFQRKRKTTIRKLNAKLQSTCTDKHYLKTELGGRGIFQMWNLYRNRDCRWYVPLQRYNRNSISRKDMRIRYLLHLLTDLLKIIGTKYKSLNKLFRLYFYPFCCCWFINFAAAAAAAAVPISLFSFV